MWDWKWDSMGGAISTARIAWAANSRVGLLEDVPEESCWFAVQMRCRFEKKAAAQLESKHIETFFPMVKQLHRWSDRRQVVEVPLFPGYGFVRISRSPVSRLTILQTVGVTGFVAANNAPIPVPEQQLEHVRLLLANNIACKGYPFLRVGQRVRIRGGCLDGLEGILISENKDQSLVISIETIQRSLALRVEGYDVEPV